MEQEEKEGQQLKDDERDVKYSYMTLIYVSRAYQLMHHMRMACVHAFYALLTERCVRVHHMIIILLYPVIIIRLTVPL